MPLAPISVVITRRITTRTATGGSTSTEAAITGSPFTARVYRRPSVTVDRQEIAQAVATVDRLRAISILNPAAPVLVNDICFVPSAIAPGGTERAKIIRIRRYADRVQCDLETGVEG